MKVLKNSFAAVFAALTIFALLIVGAGFLMKSSGGETLGNSTENVKVDEVTIDSVEADFSGVTFDGDVSGATSSNGGGYYSVGSVWVNQTDNPRVLGVDNGQDGFEVRARVTGYLNTGYSGSFTVTINASAYVHDSDNGNKKTFSGSVSLTFNSTTSSTKEGNSSKYWSGLWRTKDWGVTSWSASATNPTPNTYTITWNDAQGGRTTTATHGTSASSLTPPGTPRAKSATYGSWQQYGDNTQIRRTYTTYSGSWPSRSGTITGAASYTASYSSSTSYEYSTRYYNIRLYNNIGTSTSGDGTLQQTVKREYSGPLDPVSANPTLSGWTFDGYWSGVNGTGTQYVTASKTWAFSFNGTNGQDMTSVSPVLNIYASWKKTVTLNTNGGSGGSSSVDIVRKRAATGQSPITAPTRFGYDFTGYYSATSGGTQYYNSSGACVYPSVNGAYISTTAPPTTLYAQWTPKTSLNLTFDPSNGAFNPSTFSSKTCTYNSAIGVLPAETGATPTISKTMFIFEGWWTKNGETSGDWGTQISSSTIYNEINLELQPSANGTVYAKWDSAIRTLYLNLNFGESPPNIGQTYKAYSGATYASQNDGISAFASPAANARPGWKFMGWYTDSACTGSAITPTGIHPAGHQNRTLYAKWEEKLTDTIGVSLANYEFMGVVPMPQFSATGRTMSSAYISTITCGFASSGLDSMGQSYNSGNSLQNGIAPVNVGSYIITAYFPETADYKEQTTTGMFLITKATPSVVVSMSDFTYGNVGNPSLEKTSTWSVDKYNQLVQELLNRKNGVYTGSQFNNGAGFSAAGEVYYYSGTANDGTVLLNSTTAPTLAGNWTVSCVLPETPNFTGYTIPTSVSFEILRRDKGNTGILATNAEQNAALTMVYGSTVGSLNINSIMNTAGVEYVWNAPSVIPDVSKSAGVVVRQMFRVDITSANEIEYKLAGVLINPAQATWSAYSGGFSQLNNWSYAYFYNHNFSVYDAVYGMPLSSISLETANTTISGVAGSVVNGVTVSSGRGAVNAIRLWSWTATTVNNVGTVSVAAEYHPDSAYNNGWNYLPATGTISIAVDKAYRFEVPATIMGTYVDGMTLGNLSVPSAKYSWGSHAGTEISCKTLKSNIFYDHDEIGTDYYYQTEGEVSISIAKATLASFPAHADFNNKVYGTLLSGLSLSSGYKWITPTESVGNVGFNMHNASYTKNDNYNAITGQIRVHVIPAETGAFVPYGSEFSATFNSKVSDIISLINAESYYLVNNDDLNKVFNENLGTVVNLNVVYYQNNDRMNYNPSTAGTVGVRVLVAEGRWVNPGVLTAVYLDSLSDVKANSLALASTYIWVTDTTGSTAINPSTLVGNAGTQSRYLKYSVYGYTDVVQQVNINVSRKQSAWVNPNGGVPLEIMSGAKLNTVTLPARYTWVSPLTEGPIGAIGTTDSYAATYYEGDASNYLSISGNITVKITSYPETALFVGAGPFSTPYDITNAIMLSGLVGGAVDWDTDLYRWTAPTTLINELGGTSSDIRVGTFDVPVEYRQTLYHNYVLGTVSVTVTPLAGTWVNPGTLTAVYLDTLDEVLADGLALPEAYTWVTDISGAVEVASGTLVGVAGTQTGYLRYRVANYTDTVDAVSIAVDKKTSEWPGYSTIYLPDIYALSTITLSFANSTTWSWISSGDPGNGNDPTVLYSAVGTYIATVSYLENDDNSNYDPTTGSVNVVVVALQVALPNYPTSGVYTIAYSADGTLADVDTGGKIENTPGSNRGWYWVDSSDKKIASFGNVGAHQIEVWWAPNGLGPFVAGNELPVKVNVTLNVTLGSNAYAGATSFSAIYLDTLLDVLNAKGMSTVNYMWYDSEALTDITDPGNVVLNWTGNTNKYQLKYRISTNYNYSAAEAVSISIANGTLDEDDALVTAEIAALDAMVADYLTRVVDVPFKASGVEVLGWAWNVAAQQLVGDVGTHQWTATLTLPNYNPINVSLDVTVVQINAPVVDLRYSESEESIDRIVYVEGQTLADISHILGSNYAWSVSESTLVGDVIFNGNEIAYKAFAGTYNPEGIGSGNFIESSVTILFKVYPAEGVWVDPVLTPGNELVYTPGAEVGDIAERLPQYYSFVYPEDLIGNATASLMLEVKYDPDTNHYPITRMVEFVVNKADVSWVEYDVEFMAYYGALLKEIKLASNYYWDFWGYAEAMGGGATYEDAREDTTVGEVGVNWFNMVYNPDPMNYNNSGVEQIKVTVRKANYTAEVQTGLKFEIEYGKLLSELYVSAAFAVLPGGAGEYRFESNYKAGVTGIGSGSGGVGEYEYILYRNNPIDDVNPSNPDASNYISSWALVTIKVIPATATFVSPSGNFSVPYGSTLGDIRITPNANRYLWAYIEDSGTVIQNGAEQLVGEVTTGVTGPRSFVVLYNPGGFNEQGEGSANYNSTSGTVLVEVVKATPVFVGIETLGAKYGQLLEEIELPANYYWTNEDDVVGNVGTNRKVVRYNPDTQSYNWVYGEVELEVGKGTLEFVDPLWEFVTSYEEGKKIGDVGFILPYGYEWAAGILDELLGDVAYEKDVDNEPVYDSNGNIIVIAKRFDNALVYNPNAGNYEDVLGSIYIVIQQKGSAFVLYEGTVQAKFGQRLAEVELNATAGGSYRWVDGGASVGGVGTQEAEVWYIPFSHNLLPSKGQVTLIVGKGEAESEEDLKYTAVYGTLVKNIVLPLNYTWDWEYYAGEKGVSVEAVKEILTVGNVFDNGTDQNKIRVLYNPDIYSWLDTLGYADITVLKAEVEWVSPSRLLEAVYGQTLAMIESTLPIFYKWNDNTQSVGPAGLSTFVARYNPYLNTVLEGNYRDAVSTVAVYVNKAAGVASSNIDRWLSGNRQQNPEVETITNRNSEVEYYYVGINGTEYEDKVIPTRAGEYTVYITIAGNENYNAVNLEYDFEIVDAPSGGTWWIWVVLPLVVLVVAGLIVLGEYYRRKARQKNAGYVQDK